MIVKMRLVISILLICFPACDKNPIAPQDDLKEGILFIRNDNGSTEICLSSPDGTKSRILSSYQYDGWPWEGYQSARWSPNKEWIIVEGGPGSKSSSGPLWLMDMEGNFIHKITETGSFPLWKNDHEVYFQCLQHIYSVDIINNEGEILEYQAPLKTLFLMTDVLAGGKYVIGNMSTMVYDSSGKLVGTSDAEIIKLELDSDSLVYITENLENDFNPHTNPEENTISFVGYRDYLDSSEPRRGNHNIYIMDLKDLQVKQVTQMTQANHHSFDHVWSPDGRYIAYSWADQQDGYNLTSDIYIVDTITGATTQFTDSAKNGVSSHIMDWR